MKNASKNGKQIIATLFFLLALTAGSFSATSHADCSCPTPSSVSITAQTCGSVTLAWQSGGCSSAYYVRMEDHSVGTAVIPSSSSVSFSNMAPGTYRIYAVTSCLDGDVQTIIFDDLIIC